MTRTLQTAYARPTMSQGEKELLRRVAATIRVMIAARGMSLRDLGRASGLSHRIVVYVAGGQREPTIVELDRIARAVGSTVVELVTTDPERLAEENRVGRDVLEGRGYGW